MLGVYQGSYKELRLIEILFYTLLSYHKLLVLLIKQCKF